MSAGFNPVVLSAQISEVPEELKSSSKPKPIPLSRAQMAVPSQSATQNSGGQVLFQLNSSNGFIKPGSVMLKCRVTLVSAGNTTADTIVAWGNACRNSSAIIDRFTVSSGAVLESINNYGSSYVPTLLLHCANQPYTQNDDALLEGAKRPTANANGSTSVATNGWRDVANATAFNTVNTYVDVCIPLYSNLFQNEHGFPLCLLAQNTMIQLDLAQFGKAFFISAGGNGVVTDFQVSNAFLVYDLIQPSPEYIMALKDQMRQGMLYQIPFVSALGSQFAKQGASTTVNWGVGVSSLKGVTYSTLVAPATVTDAKYLTSDCAVNGAGCNLLMANSHLQLSKIRLHLVMLVCLTFLVLSAMLTALLQPVAMLSLTEQPHTPCHLSLMKLTILSVALRLRRLTVNLPLLVRNVTTYLLSSKRRQPMQRLFIPSVGTIAL
jgi:hypothetical protein